MWFQSSAGVKGESTAFLSACPDVGMESKGDEVPKLSANIKKWNQTTHYNSPLLFDD